MKKYNSIAKKISSLEKSICNYAEEVKTAFAYDDAMVEFTGYDFERDEMTADITIKVVIDRLNAYNYIKVRARIDYQGDVSVTTTEFTNGKTFYKPGHIPEEHGWGAMMMAF